MIHAGSMLSVLTAAIMFTGSALAQSCQDVQDLVDAQVPIGGRDLPLSWDVSSGECKQSDCDIVEDAPGGLYTEGCEDVCCTALQAQDTERVCSNICVSNAVDAAAQGAAALPPGSAAAGTRAANAAFGPAPGAAPATPPLDGAAGAFLGAPTPAGGVAPISGAPEAAGGDAPGAAAGGGAAPAGSDGSTSSQSDGGSESSAVAPSSAAVSWSVHGACFAAAAAGLMALA